jgi:hypothetical protein
MTQNPSTAPLGERWVLLAIARQADTAERWRDAVDAAGLDVEVRIEDGVLAGHSSAVTHANNPGGAQLFAFGLWVPASQHRDAARALGSIGWRGGYRDGAPALPAGYVVKGALAALGAAVLVIIVRAAAG